ncbi:MAG: hypothetical protein ACRCW2_01045 [Cellulosilyticaceae bacterium]
MLHHETVDHIQTEIKQKYPRNVLHILNGGCMLEAFRESGKMQPGCTYVPFNEAMCWGHADEQIFSEAFIKNRIASLDSTKEQYEQIVMTPLKPLFEEQYDLVVMWFGEDMFCQINMLTMMAYLEQVGYTGDLLLCIGSESGDAFLPEAYEVKLEGSLANYREILCQQQMPKGELLPVTYQMTKLYLGYRQEDSEINRYIKSGSKKNKEELVEELLTTFPQYGLGDLQYEQMIEGVRSI